MKTKFLWLIKLFLLLFIVSGLKAQIITLTDECNTAGITNVTPGTLPFANANTYLNASADVTATMTMNGSPFLPGCAAAGQKDGWFSFTAVNTSMVVSYTPTTAEDVAIAVYQNTCPLANPTETLLQCANLYGAGVTETANVSATVGTTYLVRVIKVSGASAAMTGKVSVYTGPRSISVGDLCTDSGATTRTLSTTSCNIPFDINARFFHNDGFGTTTPSCVSLNTPPTSTNFVDGWARIDLTPNQAIRVSYTHTTKDAEITIYSGGAGGANATICTGLTQLFCGNNVGTATGTPITEFVDVTSASAGTFYIRVTNRTDRNTMTGTLCISELIARDLCTNAIPGIKLGDCSVPFDITSSATPTLTNTNNDAGATTEGDIWTYFDSGSVTDSYVLEFTSNNQIRFAVYETSSPGSFCSDIAQTLTPSLYAKLTNGQPATLTAGSSTSASFILKINPSRRYFIRAYFAGVASNLLCLYKSDKKSEDYFHTSALLSNTGSDCGIQFNLLRNYENNGITGSSLNTINCASTKNATNDGWASFTPMVGGTYIIEYNNDNKSSSIANDVMLSIYRTPVITLAADFGGKGRATYAALRSAPTVNVNNGQVSSESDISITTTGINTGDLDGVAGDDSPNDNIFNPGTDGEKWFRIVGVGQTCRVRLEVATGTAALEYFEVNRTTGNISTANDLSYFDVGNNPKVLGLKQIGSQDIGIDPDVDYYIRVIKVGTTILTGKLIIYYPGATGANMQLVNTMCADNVVEGVETLTLTGTNIVAGSHYFIRVANKVTGSTVGTLCIRDNSVVQGDLCSNATGLLVGSCDVSFNVPLTFTRNQPLPTVPSCVASTGFVKDGWMSFTATSTQTTIEYKSDADVALAVYRGSCSNLIYINCINADPDDGIETIKITNSIIGLTYYVRVMTLVNTTTNGNVCIYNNNERDVCDDNDMVTRVVGDCNLPFNIPVTFDNSTLSGGTIPVPYRDFAQTFPITEPNGGQTILPDYASTCDGNLAATNDALLPNQSVAKDAWIRVIGNGNFITLLYNNKEATSNPSLIVYTALKATGPVNCGSGLDGAGNGTAANQYACTNRVATPGLQTESVTFTTNAGQLYLVRILDLTGTGMTGQLCVSRGRQDYEDPCINSGGGLPGPSGRSVTIGECSIPMNIVTGLNTCSVPNTFTTVTGVKSIYNEGFANFPTGWVANPNNNNAWALNGNRNSSGYAGASGGNNMRMRNSTTSGTVCTLISNPISTVGFTGINVTWGARKSGNVPATTFEWRIGAGAWTPVSFTDVTNNSTWALVNAGVLPAGAEGIPNLQFRFSITSSNTGDGFGSNDYTIDDFEIRGTSTTLPTPNYNGISTTDCAQGNKDCVGGDVWATVTIPSVCNPATAAGFTTQATCTGAGYIWNTSNNTCSCPANTIRPTFPNTFTVQYDNRDGLLTPATDVRMVIYDASVSGFDCRNQNTYKCVGYSDSVGEGIEAATIQFAPSTPLTAPATFPTAGKTYLIRIINKSATASAYGNLCLMYGSSLSSTTCPPTNCYGELEGEFVPFNVPGGTYVNVNTPSRTIPNCVAPGGSSPSSDATNPIRSQGWMAFTVPATANYTAVSVQYNNDLTSGNDPNAAIAIYTAPNMPSQTASNICPPTPQAVRDANCVAVSSTDPNGVQYLACSNAVFQGPETITFTIQKGRTYYVRVMNVDNVANPSDLNGLIRVFPFAQCSPGPELVTDGKFDMWPDIRTVLTTRTSPSGLTSTPLTGATRADNTTPIFIAATTTIAQDNAMIAARNNYDTKLDAYVLQTPNVDFDDAYPNNLDNNSTTGIVRFATDYGYVRDISNENLPTTGLGNSTILTYAEARSEQGELNPEGRYLIRQTPWTVKGDWYGYGNGYSGYGGGGGGGTAYSYCSAGNQGFGDEACVTINRGVRFGTTNGTYNDLEGRWTNTGVFFERPRALPDTKEANFMIVNGSYDPNSTLSPGKVWCQTINRGASSIGKVGYYIFSVWVQNMISGGRNLDVPMMRMTVCDMEDPLTGAFPTSVDVDPSAANTRLSRLPGVTDVLNRTTGALLNQVQHFPIPPVDRVKAPRVDFSYGAAMSCNLSSEARDRRLKTLGASFLVTETPDRWKPIRCVYRAPQGVVEMNICLENLSLTQNGNDFAIDDISFYECLNPDAETFDKLLKGDPCELTDNPQSVDILLGASMLDFSGRLMGDRVVLSWLTTKEDQTLRYEIQRSHDGTNFYAVGYEDARGVLAGVTAEYNHTDRELPAGAKTLYYRLNIIENSGYSRFSNLISIGLNNIETFDLKLIPNPVKTNDEVEVRFNVSEGMANIGVFDMMGTRLMTTQMTTSNGENRVMISTKGMITGIYLVKVIHNGKTVTKKLVVH